MKKTLALILILIFSSAFFLRVMYLPKGILTFGYDQARDALVSQQIVNGDLKILGPPASTPGLYHGVFYYYLLAPAYWLGDGNPIATAYWIAFLNALVVFLVLTLTYLLSKNKTAAILAAFLYAVSFEATQYATWLSNPTIGIWTVPLMYLGLWIWVKKEKAYWWLGPILSALGLGLSIQSEIFLLYHIVPLVIWLWVGKKNIEKKQIVVFFLTLGLTLSSMIISEIKFGFKGIGGALSLLASQDSIIAAKGLGDFILLYLNQIGRVFALNSYPGNIGYGGVFVLVVILIAVSAWQKRKGEAISWELFLASWLFSHITVTSVGGTSTPFLLVGIGPAVSILLGITLSQLWEKRKILAFFLLAILTFGNLSMILKENPRGSTIFAIQKDLILKKELAVVDYTYQKSAGKPFSTNSLTSPLWINIVWTYLYKWYGLPKYGYLPEWHGRDQVGQLDSLSKTDNKTENYFLILEPMAGIPMKYLDEAINEEDAVSRFIEEKNFGEIRVQYRLRK